MADLRWYFMIEKVENAVRDGDADALGYFRDYLRDYENPFSVHIRQWLIQVLMDQRSFRLTAVRRPGRTARVENADRDQRIYERVEQLADAKADVPLCRKIASSLNLAPAKIERETVWNAQRTAVIRHDSVMSVGPFRWKLRQRLSKKDAYRIAGLEFGLGIPAIKKIVLRIAKAVH